MKNSTLLRLFFISIGLPLTCASSSSTSSSFTPSTSTPSTPTPSTLTTKSKSKTTSLLVDKTTTAPAVQLGGAGTGVPSVSGIGDPLFKKLKAFINDQEYEEITKLADGMDKDEFLRHFCQVMITFEYLTGFGYLKHRRMVPYFLAHGEIVVVKKVIIETRFLECNGLDLHDTMSNAIALSLEENRYERVESLFEAVHKKLGDWSFDTFVGSFFKRYYLEKDSMPLKRFLTLYGEEFSKEHHGIFETICRVLVERLSCRLDNPASKNLLIDFVGQPALLTPIAFAKQFLFFARDPDRFDFIKHGYKEAIEEGLKEEYCYGGKYLWKELVRTFSGQFPEEYPSADKARAAALKNFKPTKQDREEEWAKKHAPIFLPKLKAKLQEDDMSTLLPAVLWDIIAEYAANGATWIDV